jgi:hypothetical protein
VKIYSSIRKAHVCEGHLLPRLSLQDKSSVSAISHMNLEHLFLLKSAVTIGLIASDLRLLIYLKMKFGLVRAIIVILLLQNLMVVTGQLIITLIHQ